MADIALPSSLDCESTRPVHTQRGPRMNMSVAILVGAALIGGSVVWASERAARDTRCAGYLASNDGGLSLGRVAVLELNNGGQAYERKPDSRWAIEESGLRMAGCRLDRPT